MIFENQNKSISTLNLLKKFYLNLKNRYKTRLFFVIFIMVLSAIMQSISVLFFVPFINLLMNPSLGIISESKYNIKLLFLPEINLSLFDAGIIVITVIVLSSLLQILNISTYSNFNRLVISNMNSRLFKFFISLPYQEHIQINSSKYLNLITLQVENASSCLMLILQFFTSLLLSLFLILTIFLINFKVGFFTLIIFSFIYYFLTIRNKKSLNKNSKIVSNLNRSQIKLVQESYSFKRDLILSRLNKLYTNIFLNREFSIRRLKTNNILLSNVPKFLIEGLSLVFLVLTALILVRSKAQSAASVISLLGTFALASQKLIYNLQKLYSAWVNFKFRSDSFNEVLDNIDLVERSSKRKTKLEENYKPNKNNISFDQNIRLVNINYSYKGSNFFLKNINLEIAKGEIIGLVGETGCGKSTLQDLLLGLLTPTSGKILIDEKELKYSDKAFMDSWYSLIGHVPQSISITDDSILNNICMGENNKIDYKNIKIATNAAMINEFIESLPMGYNSRIGENGIMISGGQKQRIGIARALYKKPSILFLDEATSALDVRTERALMRKINALDYKPTIIMIAHRLDTLSYCDKVFEINNGELNQIEVPK